MRKLRIGIIGHFGGPKKFNDGQTIKTLTIYRALKEAGFEQTEAIDTYYIRKSPFRFIRVFVAGLLHDQKIIILLSYKGRRVLFPILYWLARYMKKEIYHYSIGGRLASEVKRKRHWKKYISAFKGNWVESHALEKELGELGVKNAVYIPNFKRLNSLAEQNLQYAHTEPYKFCLFSRVMAEKGVEDAITAICDVNRSAGRQIAVLDIYGMIEPAYSERLREILQNTNDCNYCGVVPAEESVETLKGYFALLFPTHWRHEGIPGTIIDALSAGIPVIARKWQYCDEMIEDGYTGLVYDFDKPKLLKEKILTAIENSSQMFEMKKHCLQKAKEYSENRVIKQILKEMGVD